MLKNNDVTIPEFGRPSKDSLCAVWVPLVECEVASGSYTAWRNENRILADIDAAVIHMVGGAKLFVASCLMLLLYTHPPFFCLHFIYPIASHAAHRRASYPQAKNCAPLMCSLDQTLRTRRLFSALLCICLSFTSYHKSYNGRSSVCVFFMHSGSHCFNSKSLLLIAKV